MGEKKNLPSDRAALSLLSPSSLFSVFFLSPKVPLENDIKQSSIGELQQSEKNVDLQ